LSGELQASFADQLGELSGRAAQHSAQAVRLAVLGQEVRAVRSVAAGREAAHAHRVVLFVDLPLLHASTLRDFVAGVQPLGAVGGHEIAQVPAQLVRADVAFARR
jgi:hypothetical protein